ncbi:MAG: response regulator [Deltaproteobacteria bacterium]|nr:response regulator [Deltaproteobacteria bacterium]
MEWNLSSLITTIAGTALLTLVYGFLFWKDRRAYLGLWAGGWGFGTLRYVILVQIPHGVDGWVGATLDHFLLLLSGLLLLYANALFVGKHITRRWAIFTVLATIWLAGSRLLNLHPLAIAIPPTVVMAALNFQAAIYLLTARSLHGVGKQITGWSFVLLGLNQVNDPLFGSVIGSESWQTLLMPSIGVFVAFGMLLLYFERLKDEVIEGEQRYRLLAENARDVIFRWRLRPTPGVEYVSPSIFQLIGYTPEEFYNDPMKWSEIIHPEDLVGPSKAANGKGMPKQPLLLRLIARDGRIVHSEHQLVPIFDQDGQFSAIEGICRDVSDRVKAEQEREQLAAELLHAQKMEALGSLAGGVAHDINNVLAAVMGVASVMKRHAAPDSKKNRNLEMILSSCARGRDLTRNLLGFAHKGMLRRESISLEQVAGDVVELLRRTLPKRILIEISSPDAVLPAIEGDPTQLEQLVMNLCLNAADAIEGSGIVSIALAVDQGSFVSLRVADTGKGMDEETLEHVFEPFYTTKPSGEGTGLGLTMVHNTARNHGGVVDIESELGKGTVITLRLPAIDAPAPTGKPLEKERDMDAKGREVLLVDDERAVLESGEQMLGEIGFKVATADSGRKACAIYGIKHKEIALVILDVSMPDLDGVATYKKLKEINPAVIVLFTSGFARETLSLESELDASTKYLQKPFSVDELAQAIRAVLP